MTTTIRSAGPADAGLIVGFIAALAFYRSLFAEAAEAEETPGQQVVTSMDAPVMARGSYAVIYGDVAPEGAVIKLTGITADNFALSHIIA